MSETRELISRQKAQAPFFAGIDLGGTNIKLGLVDDEGRAIAYRSVPTEVEKGPEEGARRMADALRRVIADAGLQAEDVVRVGLGTPGTMDIPSGRFLHPHNLRGWDNFPIRDALNRHCGLPVTYTNDANAAAFGEYWCGSGREFHSMIFLTLGTGVGGGIIVGDLSIEGEHSAGAECGHIIIDSRDDARRCPCGALGHLEAYASATGVVGRAEDALNAGRISSLAKRRHAGEEITALLIAREAEAGDAFALELVMETARYLGIGIVTLIHTIDPNGVVLGGAMTFGGSGSDLGRKFLARVREEVTRLGLPPVTQELSIDFATLGSDAGYVGAAGLARLDFRKARTA